MPNRLRRWANNGARLLRRLRRRLYNLHDSPGPASHWRAIYDGGFQAWEFYDEAGRYSFAVDLAERPSGRVVDFLAAIYETGFEAGVVEATPRTEARRRIG